MKVIIEILAAFVLVHVCMVCSWDRPRFASPGQFPHQVSLTWSLPPQIPSFHSCGGAILTKFWIISSGYCISNIPNLGITLIKAGLHNISLDDKHVQIREIKRMIVHEKYPGVHTLANLADYDIGLIQLKLELIFNDRVKPIQLPNERGWFGSGHKLSYNMVLSGWSSVSYGVLADQSNTLRTVNVPVVSNKVCMNSIQTIFPLYKMSNLQMCTRPLDGSLAACIGDFGGPLIQQENIVEPVLVGILTYSLEPCTTNGKPPVYTSVIEFVKWIEKNTKEQK